MLHITVIGTGFVGVVSSAVFASFGNTVYGLDVLQEKVDMLTKGVIPFYEPGLEELVKDGIKKGNLIFTTSYKEAIPQSDLIILAVGTPSAKDGQADLTYIFQAAESLAPFIKENTIVAIKSTVPPGTNNEVEKRIKAKTNVKFFMASLPEFLREGTAVQDTLYPDRVILGTQDNSVIEKLKELHKPLNAPFVIMKPESAQMCKYTANAYLATRITFINQIANLCEVNGANVLEIIEGIGYDKRIGKHYWYPGLGYGGSCFPKDVKELAAYAKAIGQDGNLMVKISELNEERILSYLHHRGKDIGGWEHKHVSVLGLSFKPNTDDMREAPSTKVVPYILKQGSIVSVFDPMAMDVAKRMYPDWNVSYQKDAYTCMKDADVVMVLVEWPEIVSLDVPKICQQMKKGGTFLDVRNQYFSKKSEFEKMGIRYRGIGMI